jgi:hypothetical protein
MAYYNDQNVIAPLDRYGKDDQSWNLPDHPEGDESGYPGLGILANAISAWSVLQPGTQATVGDAAKAFYMTPRLVVLAVKFDPWMYLDEDGPVEDWVIGHDGE